MKQELLEIRDKYGDDRMTEIQDVEDEIDIEDLIEEETCVFTLTAAGYIKRMPVSTYRAQKRGGKGVSAQSLREEDYVDTLFTASSHDNILFFTSSGRVTFFAALASFHPSAVHHFEMVTRDTSTFSAISVCSMPERNSERARDFFFSISAFVI